MFLGDADGRKIAERVYKHTGEELAEMAAWLMANSGAVEASQIQIAIEVPHGSMVETLIERDFKVHETHRERDGDFQSSPTMIQQ